MHMDVPVLLPTTCATRPSRRAHSSPPHPNIDAMAPAITQSRNHASHALRIPLEGANEPTDTPVSDGGVSALVDSGGEGGLETYPPSPSLGAGFAGVLSDVCGEPVPLVATYTPAKNTMTAKIEAGTNHTATDTSSSPLLPGMLLGLPGIMYHGQAVSVAAPDESVVNWQWSPDRPAGHSQV